METMSILIIATFATFYMYSNLSVYKSLYAKTQEENYEVGFAKNKLEKLYKKQHAAYHSISQTKDSLSVELNTSIAQYKKIKVKVDQLKGDKAILETKIEQLYDTIGNS